tara:strand:- start:169 stop:438 length:270 start_codon:yes stop_codon:yes gene_type:complete
MPKEYDKLLVVCRGASFSSIGASTCRLSRWMINLSQAAGVAAAMYGRSVKQYDADELRQILRNDGIALELADGYLDAMPEIKLIHEPDG